MAKTTSCGVIVTDGNVILVGHSTGNVHWDIPKGGMDDGETFLETALRELREETGIELTSDEVSSIGVSDYTKRKDLFLCFYRSDRLPDIQTLECSSMCTIKGREFPEFDGFKYIKIIELDEYVTPNMARTLKKYVDLLV